MYLFIWGGLTIFDHDSLWALMGPPGARALMGPLGPYGPGPYGPPWALMGRALMGLALMGPLGPYGPGPNGPGIYICIYNIYIYIYCIILNYIISHHIIIYYII